MQLVVVIPARMASTRFPGKPLADLCGKPMLRWVYEAVLNSNVAQDVVIATPDQAINDACQLFGARVIMTSDTHLSGTDRVAEVALQIVADAFLNVQGDEPLVAQESIRACAHALLDNPEVNMSSVYCPLYERDAENPNVVKVVTDRQGDALYFSRYAIPFPRNSRSVPLKKHIGIYGYRKEVLAAFTTWPLGHLEQAESLEQLRFLENNVGIRMVLGKDGGVAVDTPAQAEEVRAILVNQS